MYVHIIIAVIGVSALVPLQAAKSADWSQWRGNERDGRVSISREVNLDAKPKLLWKVEVGQGHSSPVTKGDRVFILSRQKDDEVVACLSLKTGETIWRQHYPAPYTMNSAAYSHGKGPKSTPLVHKGRLFTLGISGILSCFDAGTGKLNWRHEFSGEFDETSPLYGAAMSPIAVGNLVVVHVGGEVDGAFRAYETGTGRAVWSWKGDGPGYASPVLVNFQNVPQLVTQGQESIFGVRLSDGKELWKLPFSTPWQQNSVTPLVYRDLLILSGLDQGVFAVRLRSSGGKWIAEQVWSRKDVSMYMSSPVLTGGLLFGLSHFKQGQFFLLEPGGGEVLWKGEGRQGDYAAFLSSKDRLLVQKIDGDFLLLEKAGEEFQKVIEYSLADSPTWAHPAMVGSLLLVKDFSSLACWSF